MVRNDWLSKEQRMDRQRGDRLRLDHRYWNDVRENRLAQGEAVSLPAALDSALQRGSVATADLNGLLSSIAACSDAGADVILCRTPVQPAVYCLSLIHI